MGPERKVCGNHHRSLSVRLWAMTIANNDNGLFFPGGGGAPHMKGVGLLVENFKLNP